MTDDLAATVGGAPSPLRCHDPACRETGEHSDHQLRAEIVDAFRHYPDEGEPWWFGPEQALAAVERHMGLLPAEDES